MDQHYSAFLANWFHSYHRFLVTQAAENHVPDFTEELDWAQLYIQQEEDDSLQDDEPVRQQDDWMQLCALNTQYDMHTSSDSTFIDWSEYARSLPQHKVREAPTCISSSGKDASHSDFAQHLPPVDISTLNHR